MTVNEPTVLRGFRISPRSARRLLRLLSRALGAAIVILLSLVQGAVAESSAPHTVLLHPADGSLVSALLYRPDPAPTAAKAVVWFVRDTSGVDPSLHCLAQEVAYHGSFLLVPRGRVREARHPLRGAGEVFGDRQGDGVAALGYLLDSLAIPIDRVVLAGEEGGAALAAWTASRVRGAPLGFIFLNPRFVVSDLDVLPIVRAVDRPCLALVEEEVPWSFESGRSLFLTLRSRCRLWHVAGAAGRLAGIFARPEACASLAVDLARWMEEAESP